MIKVDMSSSDLDRQIELLKFYPEIMQRHFAPTLQRDVTLLEARIKPTIPRLSGLAQKTFRSSVTGSGISLTGRVGWFGNNAPWYPNVLEYGAKPHAMNTYVPRLSKRIKVHPGVSKRGFMAAGYKSIGALIHADMAKASEAVLNELEVR